MKIKIEDSDFNCLTRYLNDGYDRKFFNTLYLLSERLKNDGVDLNDDGIKAYLKEFTVTDLWEIVRNFPDSWLKSCSIKDSYFVGYYGIMDLSKVISGLFLDCPLMDVSLVFDSHKRQLEMVHGYCASPDVVIRQQNKFRVADTQEFKDLVVGIDNYRANYDAKDIDVFYSQIWTNNDDSDVTFVLDDKIIPVFQNIICEALRQAERVTYSLCP